MAKKSLIIILLLFVSSVFPSIISDIQSTAESIENNQYLLSSEIHNQNNEVSNVIIKDFTSNFNKLIITIENTGEYEIFDLKMDIEIAGGIFITPFKKHYEILSIPPGNEISKQISISGLGYGIIFDHPKFTFTIKNANNQTIVGKVTTKILGPFIKIISKSFNNNLISDGFTLIAPMWDRKTYLLDKEGDVVHFWKSNHLESQAAYLLENGNLIRTSIVPFSNIFSGGAQGFIEMFDWNGTRIWKYKHSTDKYCQHHDIEILPNGNILLISWEIKTSDEAIAAGKDPDKIYRNQLWTDYIVEIEPGGELGGNIVWEWHAWDHLIQDYDSLKDNYGEIKNHPELIDINFGKDWRDWLHVNSIDYHEEFDQILISVFNFNEIWVIDHNTTTEEAAGHTGGNSGKGGDLLYRWGNPATYNHGNISDQQFFGQHGSYWIENGYPNEGNILVFNNRGGDIQKHASSVVEIIPPVNEKGEYSYIPGKAFEPKEPTWTYVHENPSEIYSNICSNAQRLLNGNTLICSATQGRIYEVTFDKKIVWIYYNTNPFWYYVKTIPEAIKYPTDYPGLKNLD